MSETVLVFAKYPAPGKCKTRLIGALGPTGAADLQREMTRHTLRWCRELRDSRGVRIVVFYSGCEAEQMRQLYGDEFTYCHQSGNGLGHRLSNATESICTEDLTGLVIVGTDCPQLNCVNVGEAFDRLKSHDVAITPAADGGYVLLGMSKHAISAESINTALFQGIDWGTERVLEQTAESLSVTEARVSLLPVLRDVDVPSDLPVWKNANSNCVVKPPILSVVVPTYNTESQLKEVIDAVCQANRSEGDCEVEVIVAAAGSTAHSLIASAQNQVQLIMCDQGRAKQMNAGAKIGKSDRLLFLHADTIVEATAVQSIIECLEGPDVIAGAFRLRIASNRWLARLVELGVSLRSRILKTPYGDQGIFLTRKTFELLGGFKNIPVMEDYEFIRRIRKLGKVRICEQVVTTSARRWTRMGILKTTLVNQLMIAGYHLGIPPQELAKFYRRF